MTDAGGRRTIDLARVFAPRSIAMVGASPRNHTARILRDNLGRIGSTARLHLVNPRYADIEGLPCHPDLAALPEVPDSVLINLGPERVAPVVEQAAHLGVTSVVIPGGGVVEGGEPARLMQLAVARIARETGLAVIGPNCMGFIDHTTRSAVYTDDVNPWQPAGGVAGIAQSGSVTDAFVQSGTRIGWSRIVSCGAEVSLDVCDYLAYCLDDPATHSVVMFVEGFKRPERFLALADRALGLGKAIAMVKVGRSRQAQAAAVAHSGSLAGEDRAMSAALDAVGVIGCHDLDELLEMAELLAGCRRLGRGVGRGRTGVVTVSTGEASMIADLAPELGLDLPPPPPQVHDRLAAALPTLGYIGNPIDPWGAVDAETAYGAAFDAFATPGAYDVLALVHDSPYRELPAEVETGTTVAAALVAATRDRPDLMPVLVSLTSGEISHDIRRPLDEAGGIPYLRGLREGFGAIARRARWEAARDRRAGREPRRPGWPAIADDRTTVGYDERPVGDGGPVSHLAPLPDGVQALPERESLALVGGLGVPVAQVRAVVGDPAVPGGAGVVEPSVEAAAAIGYPVALKLDAVGLAHKSDVGGVRLGLVGGDAVRAAAAELWAVGQGLPATVTLRGLLVTPMAGPGLELIAGLVRDPHVGPTVLVGLGGVFTELLDDVALGLAPLDEDDALALLGRLRGSALLDGARGRPAVDRRAVARVLVALGRLAVERPDIAAVDLNPVIASQRGALAVDALVVIAGPEHLP